MWGCGAGPGSSLGLQPRHLEARECSLEEQMMDEQVNEMYGGGGGALLEGMAGLSLWVGSPQGGLGAGAGFEPESSSLGLRKHLRINN